MNFLTSNGAEANCVACVLELTVHYQGLRGDYIQMSFDAGRMWRVLKPWRYQPPSQSSLPEIGLRAGNERSGRTVMTP